MKHSNLRQTFFAVAISMLAFPAFVQSQTATGGALNSGVKSPSSETGMRGAETPGAPGSSRMQEGSSSPSSSSMSSANRPGVAMNDQGITETDRTLNQKIRQELTSDSSLGSLAKNVHFNTQDGKVTLHGTVMTDKEKQDIEAKVEKMSGVKDVDNQLQIASAAPSASGSRNPQP